MLLSPRRNGNKRTERRALPAGGPGRASAPVKGSFSLCGSGGSLGYAPGATGGIITGMEARHLRRPTGQGGKEAGVASALFAARSRLALRPPIGRGERGGGFELRWFKVVGWRVR